MKKYKAPLIALNLVALVVFFIYSVLHKEHTLASGRLIFLELAPVDPRSLMQGDYMRLRYRLISEMDDNVNCHAGVCAVAYNDSSIATAIKLTGVSENTLSKQECLLKYGCNDNELHLGAESYFFEEGQGEKYDSARYGGLRVDEDGNSVLIGLFDARLNQIK